MLKQIQFLIRNQTKSIQVKTKQTAFLKTAIATYLRLWRPMGYEFLHIWSWGRDYTKSKKYNLIELWIRPVSLSLFDLQRFTTECGTSTRYRFVDKVA